MGSGGPGAGGGGAGGGGGTGGGGGGPAANRDGQHKQSTVSEAVKGLRLATTRNKER